MDQYGNVYHINCGVTVLTVVKWYDYNILQLMLVKTVPQTTHDWAWFIPPTNGEIRNGLLLFCQQ